MEAPYKSVCVKACPKFDYADIMYTKNSSKYTSPIYFKDFSKSYAGLSHTNDPNFSHHEGLSYDEGFANGHYTEK